MKLRVARATQDLSTIRNQYEVGLDLQLLAEFQDHDGFDGVILGHPGSAFHFEFTSQRGSSAPLSHSEESLIVIYCESESEFEGRLNSMRSAGFSKVPAHNPYWEKHGVTFEDFENYRVVICRTRWTL